MTLMPIQTPVYLFLLMIQELTERLHLKKMLRIYNLILRNCTTGKRTTTCNSMERSLKHSDMERTRNWRTQPVTYFEDIIEEKNSTRDLGIIMSDDATFSIHVEQVCSKVRQKSGWIMRTFQSRNTWFLKFMWKTLVQGHVDYCSQLYFPAKSSDMEKIENLQKIFTKRFQKSDIWTTGPDLNIWTYCPKKEEWRDTGLSMYGKFWND